MTRRLRPTAVAPALVALLVAATLWWLVHPAGAAAVQQAGTDRHVVRVITHRGDDVWLVEVDDRAGRPASLRALVLEPVMPQMGHALEPVAAEESAPGRYRARVLLPMSGPWQVTVRLRDDLGDEQVVVPVPL